MKLRNILNEIKLIRGDIKQDFTIETMASDVYDWDEGEINDQEDYIMIFLNVDKITDILRKFGYNDLEKIDDYISFNNDIGDIEDFKEMTIKELLEDFKNFLDSYL